MAKGRIGAAFGSLGTGLTDFASVVGQREASELDHLRQQALLKIQAKNRATEAGKAAGYRADEITQAADYRATEATARYKQESNLTVRHEEETGRQRGHEVTIQKMKGTVSQNTARMQYVRNSEKDMREHLTAIDQALIAQLDRYQILQPINKDPGDMSDDEKSDAALRRQFIGQYSGQKISAVKIFDAMMVRGEVPGYPKPENVEQLAIRYASWGMMQKTARSMAEGDFRGGKYTPGMGGPEDLPEGPELGDAADKERTQEILRLIQGESLSLDEQRANLARQQQQDPGIQAVPPDDSISADENALIDAAIARQSAGRNGEVVSTTGSATIDDSVLGLVDRSAETAAVRSSESRSRLMTEAGGKRSADWMQQRRQSAADYNQQQAAGRASYNQRQAASRADFARQQEAGRASWQEVQKQKQQYRKPQDRKQSWTQGMKQGTGDVIGKQRNREQLRAALKQEAIISGVSVADWSAYIAQQEKDIIDGIRNQMPTGYQGTRADLATGPNPKGAIASATKVLLPGTREIL